MVDSLRARITLLYTCVLALILVIFAAVTYFSLASLATQQTDSSLAESVNAFAGMFAAEQNGEDAESGDGSASEMVRDFRFMDRTFIVYDESRRVIASSDSSSIPQQKNLANASPAVPPQIPPSLLEDAARAGSAYATLPGRGENEDDGFRAFAKLVRVRGRTYTITALLSLHDEEGVLERLRRTFYVSIPLSLLLASLSGYYLARKSLAPVVRMGDKAARIGAANLHERLPIANERDELGRLAHVFNDLLSRLDQSFEQQRRFMADASHELRTPVAIMRGEAEVVLSQEERTPQDYRESLTIVHDEGRRLTRIVEDLFTLARADAGQYQIKLSDFYLEELVGDSARAVRTLAAKRQVGLCYESAGELPFRGDEALIRRMIINLLDNAIKYSPAGGNVRVTCLRRGPQYVLTVADTGSGVPPEAQSHIFERFYRADKARSRTEDVDGGDAGSGAGLGLSIARWIAEVHQGQLELLRSDETGSTFVATLPGV